MREYPNNVQLKRYFHDTYFEGLMQERIKNVLLVCSKYDAFMLEEDGRIEEQIFNEYVSLNLRNPPNFIKANSIDQALEILKEQDIDLIINMLSEEGADVFECAGKIKKSCKEKPVVVLTYFSRNVILKLEREDLSDIDYVFSWLGNADILLAIIKLIEDKMNIEHDAKEEGVHAILLVENSIRFYSSYLPNIYKIVFEQSQRFMVEGLNKHRKMLRKRGRPKVLLALNYEEAVSLYRKYKNHLLGIISDISFSRKGKTDMEAGVKLCKYIRKDNEYIPFILQSSKDENIEFAKKLNVGFINKHSRNISIELREYIYEHFAFGDFVFKMPFSDQIVARAPDLHTLHKTIQTVPDESLEYHLKRNDFSKWMFARALFPLGEMFRQISLENFENIGEIRDFLYNAISDFRLNRSKGIIAKFDRKRYSDYLIFTRIGEGSIGGKARGLAFIDKIIKDTDIFDKYKNVCISIPRTTVLSTELFDEFMESNQLYGIGLSDLDDTEILNHFIKADLNKSVQEDLRAFIALAHNPIAVRSSSLLEDSQYQPFAGIYNTYMVPNPKNKDLTLELLLKAIKCVYASVYYKTSRAYMTATLNAIDEEKMAIVLQEVCGKRYGNRFYPTISGVARSLNYYPIPPQKSKDGIVDIAFGLGKIIVNEGISLRFSPRHPKNILQLSSPEMALKNSQKYFYALDMNADNFEPSVDENINILKLKIKEAEKDRSLTNVASSFDINNNILRDGIHHPGNKVITFSNILNHNVFPLAEIIYDFLDMTQKEMNDPVETEFAVNLDLNAECPKIFNFLQIRPVVGENDLSMINLENVPEKDVLVRSESALGNGIINDLHDFVYIKPETFDRSNNKKIVEVIEKINENMINESAGYILAGPGRWGSSDSWLGIPVTWSQISAARIIIESGLHDYRIDPSQGTHFFHNLTSFKVGYFTLNPYQNDGIYDLEYLSECKPYYEDDLIKHIRFDNPVMVKIDGKNNIGIIFKPGKLITD